MKIIAFVVIILGAVVSVKANPEPLLFGDLLGFQSKTGTSGVGVGISALLGSKGLLNGLVSLPNSLLNGLLSADQGLVESLLEGPNGNLLKDFLDGSLGAVTDILNKVPCILDNFGLKVLIKLLTLVKLDSILGLNLICQADGGKDLLSILLKNVSTVLDSKLISGVLCLTKTLGLPVQSVLQLLNKIGVIGLSKVSCSGVPILQPNSSTSAIVSQLLGSLKVNTILSSGLEVVLKLATQIDLAKVLDIKTVVSQLLCLVPKEINLDALVKLIQLLGLDRLLNITTAYCKDGQPLFSDLIKATGLPLESVISNLGCVLDALSLNIVRQLLGKIPLHLLEILNSVVCSAPGFGGLLKSLLPNGLDALQPVICLLKSIPNVAHLIKLVKELEIEKLLFVGNLTCQSDSSTLNTSIPDLVANLLLSLDLNLLVGLNITHIVNLQDFLYSLNGVLDLKGLLNKIICLINGLGLKEAIDFITQNGLTAALGLNDEFCPVVNGTSGGGVLAVLSDLVGAWGENKVFELLNKLGVSLLLELADLSMKDGTLHDRDLLDNVLCIVSAAGFQPAFKLLKGFGLGPLLGISNLFCLKGQPIRLNATLADFVDAFKTCNTSDDVQCKATFQAMLDINGCASICPNCDALQPYSPTASVECNGVCSLKGCVDTAGSLTSG